MLEAGPILDLLEGTQPTDGRSWKLAPDALVEAVEGLLHEHGRLGDASKSTNEEAT